MLLICLHFCLQEYWHRFHIQLPLWKEGKHNFDELQTVMLRFHVQFTWPFVLECWPDRVLKVNRECFFSIWWRRHLFFFISQIKSQWRRASSSSRVLWPCSSLWFYRSTRVCSSITCRPSGVITRWEAGLGAVWPALMGGEGRGAGVMVWWCDGEVGYGQVLLGLDRESILS